MIVIVAYHLIRVRVYFYRYDNFVSLIFSYEPLHVSHDLNTDKLLNWGSQILLNLIYVIEERISWILAQADLKHIESSIFYKHFTKNTKIVFSKIGGMNVTISREWLSQLSWNFVQTYTLVCHTYHKIFVSNR
jgi:hypothetical protein